ncbi:hypothetical protein TBS_12000 [Thermobispora bispora]|jgi:soluble lytic murein transglycosylase-like protein|uniref:Transglycosylase SLT domain-containing protein n=1 Tax=Thermobispora bispora (strain ATCC 19993 / DSM 43833 / CBS 139.67 / JCM 10125 / KCTC 9307 / NBRC 14880 / R51) TaxID=469371 RepID=D6Y335_THEBD|nr:hypothetical protein Tbis_2200 [Thermobispora bispora DSM 43833]MBX6168765.1 transglycosylase SLT domain-containing protein [Thermobispora bispora]QSI48654.1 lytic transglycosylase domain-containing protein [Thermobispora bispora]
MIASTVLGGWCALPAWAGEPDPKPAHVRVWRTRATAGPEQKAPLKTRLKAYAFRLLTRYAWRGGEQFRCLDSLWTRESNWNHRAKNPTSGAYGIPQALPAGKMRSAGPDWRSNPRTQIRWGLRYIKERYGTPCAAWDHFRAHNWY